jgi:hypothetical protein
MDVLFFRRMRDVLSVHRSRWKTRNGDAVADTILSFV